MKKRTDKISINYDRLKKALSRRGLSMAEASRSLGYSESYISNLAYQGFITKTGSILLEKLYNIKPEEYSVAPAQKPEGEKEQVDGDRLYAIVYDAVYKAVKMALQEILDDDLQKAH